MKKLLVSFIAIAFVLVGINAFADTADLNNQKYLIINDAGDKADFTIPTTLCIPGKSRIIKVTVSPTGTSAQSEVYVALYDASSLTVASLNKVCEGEVEANDEHDTAYLQYTARGLKIANGCTIVQGAYTAVLVEWENYTP